MLAGRQILCLLHPAMLPCSGCDLAGYTTAKKCRDSEKGHAPVCFGLVFVTIHHQLFWHFARVPSMLLGSFMGIYPFPPAVLSHFDNFAILLPKL